MRNKMLLGLCISLLLVGLSAQAAVITDQDSTQPRGDLIGEENAAGQSLDPIVDGFMSPHQRANYNYPLWDDHYAWSGMAMGNAMRDPAPMAMLSVVNKFFIKYLNAIPGDPADTSSAIYEQLRELGLQDVITERDANGRLQPEDKLPIVADLCLRCHTPPGWMEGHSEPENIQEPFLKGQFWGAAFTSNPVDADGLPVLWDPTIESESEMDGIQCDFCHRAADNFKTTSNYDPAIRLPNGNGGYFMDLTSSLGHTIPSMLDENLNKAFITSPELCGTCHNVTNPLFKTRTKIDGVVPDVLQPVERTYTEWRFSAYGEELLADGSPNPNYTRCQDCHAPMDFLGAQTWLINPGIGDLWGAMDELWTRAPYNYNVPKDRTSDVTAPDGSIIVGASVDSRDRNELFMQTAATIEMVNTPTQAKKGRLFRPIVRVTNQSGHKLPTGYPEGRQMWIDLRVVDKKSGWPIFASGFMFRGKLIRTLQTKVYEMVSLAEGYDDYELDGFNILDANQDGRVTHEEKEFHFIMGNKVDKDNRIPPLGFNKAAYTADAAFIIPRDYMDNDYADGQNWDDTRYTFWVPWWIKGPLEITATLKYQTFNKEFINFLDEQDEEVTEKFGGRARNIPEGGSFADYQTWGAVVKDIWQMNGKGAPVEMATTTYTVDVVR